MLIAGEPSGDLLASELVEALKKELAGNPKPEIRNPKFFGAGGAKMAEAGAELAFDMTQHSIIGLWEAVKNYGKFKRLFDQLVNLAFERRPDVIVCVDFSGFNRRFARAIRWELEVRRTRQGDWKPKIIQYVSPQVWASRPGRAKSMARDFDLLLTIFPFEKVWYAERVPELKVEFVGNPAAERYSVGTRSTVSSIRQDSQSVKVGQNTDAVERVPAVLLLPGSRIGELKRHLPVMLDALKKIQSARPEVYGRMVLPNEPLAQLARAGSPPGGLEIQIDNLADALSQSAIAIASTGTVTMECAYFGVPTVALYKTSWSTYHIGKRIIQVKYLAMPNLLANEAIFPELIQHEATAENIARAALDLLNDPQRRVVIRAKLTKVVESLGGPGASQRAARAILRLQ
jgi:lipid-A-disaccharide synthase